MAKKCIKLKIHGHVQGVTFRATTKRKAKQLGLKGYVKNLPDGTVEVVAQGPEDKVEELVDFCHKGPSAAHVTKVDKQKQSLSDFSSFKMTSSVD